MVEIEKPEPGGDQYLVASRDHTTSHYKLKNLRYE